MKRFPDRKDSVSGAGIEFLPSSVDGLFEKLALLSGEYKAGNTTTRNELVAVLDELHRRDEISEQVYVNINNMIDPAVGK